MALLKLMGSLPPLSRDLLATFASVESCVETPFYRVAPLRVRRAYADDPARALSRAVEVASGCLAI